MSVCVCVNVFVSKHVRMHWRLCVCTCKHLYVCSNVRTNRESMYKQMYIEEEELTIKDFNVVVGTIARIFCVNKGKRHVHSITEIVIRSFD